MTKPEIIARLIELEIEHDASAKKAELAALLPDGEAEENGDVEVECVWANVWTSKGKIVKGETVEVPASEADTLIEQGSCK